MKRWVLLICWLGLVSSIGAVTQYRDFKDTQGRTIRARVLKFDALTEMVTIQREGMHASKVPLNIFSEAGQAYIQDIGKSSDTKPAESEEEPKSTTESLSEEEVEAIVKQYIKALREKDTEAFEQLFYRSTWESTPVAGRGMWELFKSVDIGKLHGNNIHVTVGGYSEMIGVSGWIQLTPAGKIKYCPLIAPHPVEKAASIVKGMAITNNSSNGAARKQSLRAGVDELKKLGIPTYELESIGWNTDKSRGEINESLEKMRDWLIENGGEYDNSEPKLFLPKKQMNLVKQTLKSF